MTRLFRTKGASVALLASGAALALSGCGSPIVAELSPDTRLKRVSCAKLAGFYGDYEGTFVRTKASIQIKPPSLTENGNNEPAVDLYGCRRESAQVRITCGEPGGQGAWMHGCLPKEISDPVFSGGATTFDMVVYVQDIHQQVHPIWSNRTVRLDIERIEQPATQPPNQASK